MHLVLTTNFPSKLPNADRRTHGANRSQDPGKQHEIEHQTRLHDVTELTPREDGTSGTLVQYGT